MNNNKYTNNNNNNNNHQKAGRFVFQAGFNWRWEAQTKLGWQTLSDVIIIFTITTIIITIIFFHIHQYRYNHLDIITFDY